ncbi:site-2 protease family protein [Anthocerotibacter panamensis]|uniref:site-2 protease family protein n=1 Tax=Anthocerotibacter panamensis TaxID=2857077 RepID=UPI001C4033F5|nr:site-2 protease family protein [Anthocerotibacter panamensis]
MAQAVNKNALRIGSLFGIPFFIDFSWFFILALVTYSYGVRWGAQFPEWQGIGPWLAGLGTALLLFGSVLLHELGHSVVALAQGIQVRSISLFLFGGVARIERESKTPWDALGVALAGPLVSLTLYGIFTGLERGLHLVGGLGAMVSLVASVNLALAVFNMVPGLPLDGGNVLKALVWAVTGNPYKGVRVAAWMGQTVGLGLVALGLWLGLTIELSGLWLALIGWFVLRTARSYNEYALVQDQLKAVTVAEATVQVVPAVPAQATLKTFADYWLPRDFRLFTGEPADFWVIDAGGHLVGRISRQLLRKYAPEFWSGLRVGEVMEPVAAEETVVPTETLDEVLNRFQEQDLRELPVIYPDGRLVGQVRLKDLERIFQQERWGAAS